MCFFTWDMGNPSMVCRYARGWIEMDVLNLDDGIYYEIKFYHDSYCNLILCALHCWIQGETPAGHKSTGALGLSRDYCATYDLPQKIPLHVIL